MKSLNLNLIIRIKSKKRSIFSNDKLSKGKFVLKRRRRNRWLINKLKERFNNQCQNCDYVFTTITGKRLSYGCHIIPHAETQDDSPENILILCSKCHDILDRSPIENQIELMDNVQKRFPDTTYKRRKEWEEIPIR